MATFFLDTSALVKLYIAEPGSVWIRGIAGSAASHDLVIAGITGVETVAAIIRRLRGSSITQTDAATALADFKLDYSHAFVPIELSKSLLDVAMKQAEAHGVRGYDAVQLAAAIVMNNRAAALGMPPITLLSSDIELNTAAVAEGLLVENPNDHP